MMLVISKLDIMPSTTGGLRPRLVELPRVVNSRHHSALVWFVLQCRKGKQCTERVVAITIHL